MSTPILYVVQEYDIDGSDVAEIRIYQSFDGYLDNTQKVLAEAVKYAHTGSEYEAGDFAAAIVRVTKNAPGNIFIYESRGPTDYGQVYTCYIYRDPSKDKDNNSPLMIEIPEVKIHMPLTDFIQINEIAGV